MEINGAGSGGTLDTAATSLGLLPLAELYCPISLKSEDYAGAKVWGRKLPLVSICSNI